MGRLRGSNTFGKGLIWSEDPLLVKHLLQVLGGRDVGEIEVYADFWVMNPLGAAPAWLWVVVDSDVLNNIGDYQQIADRLGVSRAQVRLLLGGCDSATCGWQWYFVPKSVMSHHLPTMLETTIRKKR